ncbi:MAG: hypothetical protein KIT22_00880 [Verrucomicrobiae bacterium]|nr:hypothetical protein [Verrucomicrobiae bacterium]
MNPVIQRELREQARQPGLFRMRLVAAVVVLSALAWGFLNPVDTQFMPFGMPQVSAGSHLFLQIHRAVVLIILALAPALTADAIARERREATLGLLGLTPLRPLSVALGKSAASALRALTLWLAPLPMLTVPILSGGVSGIEVATVISFQMVLLFLGLAAGLAASSVTIQFRRSLALAYCLEAIGLALLLLLTGFFTRVLFEAEIRNSPLPAPAVASNPWIVPQAQTQARPQDLWWLVHEPGVIFGSPFASRYGESLPEILAKFTALRGGAGHRIWFLSLGAFVAAGVALVLLALRFVARRTERAWHEEPPRPAVAALQRHLVAPVLFGGWARRRQRRRLGQNPLLWLQHRTVAAALTRWGWLTVVLAIWIFSLGDLMFDLSATVAPLVLLGGMVFSAAGGFRAERENGTLELLLVTPLRPGQLLQSRWLAHLREFVPPVLLQLFLVAYAQGSFRRVGVEWSGWNWWLISSLVTLPWIGLWCGLRARHFLSGVLGTAFWGLLVPLLLTLVIQATINPLFFETPLRAGASGMRFFIATRLDWGVIPAVIQLVIAAGASTWVWRDLASRQFALGAVGRH